MGIREFILEHSKDWTTPKQLAAEATIAQVGGLCYWGSVDISEMIYRMAKSGVLETRPFGPRKKEYRYVGE